MFKRTTRRTPFLDECLREKYEFSISQHSHTFDEQDWTVLAGEVSIDVASALARYLLIYFL